MSACNTGIDPALPVLEVRLVGRGEDAMRMEKRLSCAGRALGVNIKIDWKMERQDAPRVYVDDKLVIDRLLETTEIERMLKPWLGAARMSKSG
ncbi:hypothetical protein [Thiolapillus brandeum]|uniref:Thioredoxin family protein n=1 Tax=Thiolapillus brandeum TaxID=1076588 RepID=A0A7U6GJU6_9GAMM|nr:hypothetical protein [Thiolapillus brandeum]BAO44900.1 conserved hypothetical protein [Thiolapillus brandeum]